MTYAVQNVYIFQAAYSGALAGMSVQGRQPVDTSSADYAGRTSLAGAWAQALDTVWGPTADSLNVDDAEALSLAFWSERQPLVLIPFTNPVFWLGEASAIAAIMTASEIYFASQGITPAPLPGGGGSGAINVGVLDSTSAHVIRGDSLTTANDVGGVGGKVTRAQASTLGNSQNIVGMVLFPANPGNLVFYVTGGTADVTMTGLAAAASPTAVVLNPATGRAQRVTTYLGQPYPLGIADDSGELAINLGPPTVNTSPNWTINVRAAPYGAQGDGVTDDTAAINAAIAVFQALALIGQGGTAPGTPVLYFPAGAYLINAPLVISGVLGGIIQGDGKYSTKIVGSNTLAFVGASSFLQLKNCGQCTVRDLTVRPPQQFCAMTAASTTGASSSTITVSPANAAALFTAGKRIAVRRIGNAGIAEAASILSVNAATGVITLAAPLTYTYAGGDRVIVGVSLMVGSYRDNAANTLAFPVTNNHCENVGLGDAGSDESIWGAGTDLFGGAPTPVTVVANAGQKNVTVRDASQITASGYCTIFSTDTATGETIQVQSVAGNVITAVSNLIGTYQPGAIVISGGATGSTGAVGAPIIDANNDSHEFAFLTMGSAAAVGMFSFNGWNSLDNFILRPVCGSTYSLVSMRQGGSFRLVGGFETVLGVDIELGGACLHPILIDGLTTEGASQLFAAVLGDAFQSTFVYADNLDKKGGPSGVGVNLVNLNSVNVGLGCTVSVNHSNLAYGAAAGNILWNQYDATGGGRLLLSDSVTLGCYGYVLNGVDMIDQGAYWSLAQPLSETLSGGATVYADGVSYGNLSGRPGYPYRRVPTVGVVLVNGLNSNVAGAGSCVLEILSAGGPSAAYSIGGFTGGYVGQSFTMLARPAQTLTVVNNDAGSTAANRIYTSTGGNLVFPAPGGAAGLSMTFLYSANAGGVGVPGWNLVSA